MFVVDVPPKHRAGDVRIVSGGYARNYLFPKGYAVPATQQHLQRVEKVKELGDKERAKEIQELQGLSEALDGLVITVTARSGQQGRLFGSITTATIAKAVLEATGQQIDRKLFELSGPIKELGTFDVKLRLHQDVVPSLTVVVNPEGRVTTEDDSDTTMLVDPEPLTTQDNVETLDTEEDNTESVTPNSNLDEGTQDVRGEGSSA